MSLRVSHFSLILLLSALPARAAESTPEDVRLALRTASALYEDIRTETLPNGLRVYLKPIPGAAAVTTMVVYKVGSADEDKTFTGLSHYLEHLMFKGTATLKPGDIDRATFRNGGSNNAFTTTDLTAYHFNFPAGQWRAALRIEADRMRNLRVDREHEFDKEKGAVIEELAGNEDRPWDLESKVLLPLLFGKKSPYGHPVIGVTQHVRDADEKVIKAHYDRWYHPNNAALIVCGGFDPDAVLAEIKKEFGPIPSGKLPQRKPEVVMERKGPVRHDMKSKFASPRLLMAFNTVPGGHPDHAALSVVEVLLAGGRTSRLYRALVEGSETANNVSANHTAGRYPGWMALYAELLPGKDLGEAEKAVLKELKNLQDQPLDPAELQRARRVLVAGYIFARETPLGLANALTEAVTTTGLDYARKYLPAVMAVTPADVQRVTRKYLDPNRRVVVRSLPPQRKGAAEGGRTRPSSAPARADQKSTVAPFDLKKAQRVVLPNGLVLLLFENRRLPIVEAHLAVRDSPLYEPLDKLGVASLTGSLLEEGTKKRSGTAIAETIESVGGVLDLGGAHNAVRVLSPDRKLGLGLLLECVTQPSFPQEGFARNRARQLAEIGEAEVQPDARALQAFLAAVYGKHPLGRPRNGTRKTVSALTRADCVEFHRKVFVPSNATLAVVGDFDATEMVEEIKALTKGWKKATLKRPDLPAVEKSKAATEILPMADASQLHFYMGHVGVRRGSPDYYKLLVMDYILGTGPGFTDRLSARLRDREGLAYTVSASITQTAGIEPGVFTCYIGTDRKNFARVKKLFLEELNRIRDTRPSARELADAKAYLMGSRLLSFESNSGIASQLLNIEHYKLGFTYLADFRKAVAAVTPEDIQEVAKKYLDPKHMVLVAAGPVNPMGEPLKAPKPAGP